MAFLTRITKQDRRRWMIEWHDARRGAGRAGRRRADCLGGNHDEAMSAACLSPTERAALANGATSAVLRKKLVRCYESLEQLRRREAQHTRALEEGPAYETSVLALVDAYLELLSYRVEIDGPTPPKPPSWDPGWRSTRSERPMRESSKREVEASLRAFKQWIPHGLESGQVTSSVIAGFIQHISRSLGQRGGHGEKKRRSPRTVNKFRGHLREFFNAFTRSASERYFRVDLRSIFFDDVEALPEHRRDIQVHTPDELEAFLEAAHEYRDPDRVADIKRSRRGKDERFRQRINPTAPVLDLTLLLACTGMRLSEAVELRWESCDLETGVLRIHAQKTRSFRYLPLVGDPQGDIAPRFVALLKAWRQKSPKSTFVLPVNGKDESPSFPKGAWAAVAKNAEKSTVGPQGLRRTFESALAMMGFPARLTAFWLGHSQQVAERHYLAFVPGRKPGATVEAVLGLTKIIDREIKLVRSKRKIRKLEERSETA